MFIKKLGATKNPARQAALVAATRSKLREQILNEESPQKLQTLAQRIAETSQLLYPAEPLMEEAKLAAERAAEMLAAAEQHAVAAMEGGKQFFKQYGIPVSGRISNMIHKHGSWTNVHAQLVRLGAGGKNFRLLCESGVPELTSEYFIAHYARWAVDEELLAHIEALLNDVTRKAAIMAKAA